MTGDWSHIDVYLTKTTDYRMLLLPGSRWEPQLLEWCAQRGSTVVALGADIPGTAFVLRYVRDDVDDVRLMSEALVGELIGQSAWQEKTFFGWLTLLRSGIGRFDLFVGSVFEACLSGAMGIARGTGRYVRR